MSDETTARTDAESGGADAFDTSSWAGIPLRECDLVMKGGITSGVVYPGAIFTLGKHHRFRSIGGASAGAIAAVMAAAAEHRRQRYGTPAGFGDIGALGKQLGGMMSSLFQPAPAMRRLFRLLMTLVSAKECGKVGRTAQALFVAYPVCALSGLIPAGVALAATQGTGEVLAQRFGEGWGSALFWTMTALSLFVGVATSILAVAAALAYDLFRRLPDNRFGICPGLKQGAGAADPAGLTDWICDGIDCIAHGRPVGEGDPPLTIGDLKQVGIELAAMTTDLSSHRPYQLPLKSNIHFFCEDEFRELFPRRVVDHLVARSRRLLTTNGENGLPKGLRQLPTGDDFPICLLARMSLSFPLLFQVVPLYRFDDGLKRPGEAEEDAEAEDRMPSTATAPAEVPFDPKRIRRCLFSDGGITSNFPVHFFDGLLPTRPTFGITLADLDEIRHGDEDVFLPTNRRTPSAIPVKELSSIPDFAMAIVDTAKDWHDMLQSLLPGYAERIVEIRLDPKSEGGMNLAMDDGVIAKLVDKGTRAGALFGSGTFDMVEHCNRRALTVLPQLGAATVGIAGAFAPATNTWNIDYEKVISNGGRVHAKASATFRAETLLPFARTLAMAGEDHRDAWAKAMAAAHLPVVDARIRLVADADRVPRRGRPDATS